MSGRKRDKGTIIVRREEVVEGGHHGGAWKVAYADFVTALMAFFLLMWLLNATTQEQKRGLADYFSPSNHLATALSGSGAPFGGRTPNSDGTAISDNGAVQIAHTQPYPVTDDDDTGDQPSQFDPAKIPGTASQPRASDGGASAGHEQAEPRATNGNAANYQEAGTRPPRQAEVQAEVARREKREFERAASQIRDAVATDPGLADIAKQLMIDVTQDGLRIQLLDADRTPMFSTGSSALNDRARAVLMRIAPVLIKMHESVAISGHTDATPYKGGDKTNWDLSAERANATRRLLTEAGLPEARLRSVSGNADRDPLIPEDPLAAANRRISVVLLRDAPAPKR